MGGGLFHPTVEDLSFFFLPEIIKTKNMNFSQKVSVLARLYLVTAGGDARRGHVIKL